MRKIWFKKTALAYLPVSPEGWAITVIHLLILIRLFRMIDSSSHSGSDTLLNFSPLLILASLIFVIIARNTSDPK